MIFSDRRNRDPGNGENDVTGSGNDVTGAHMAEEYNFDDATMKRNFLRVGNGRKRHFVRIGKKSTDDTNQRSKRRKNTTSG